jgi:hypothetical protein
VREVDVEVEHRFSSKREAARPDASVQGLGQDQVGLSKQPLDLTVWRADHNVPAAGLDDLIFEVSFTRRERATDQIPGLKLDDHIRAKQSIVLLVRRAHRAFTTGKEFVKQNEAGAGAFISQSLRVLHALLDALGLILGTSNAREPLP